MTSAVAAGVFSLATVAVLLAAPRMARVSEQLTSRTRVGAALFGAIFLGASTSLPGVVVTVSAALAGQPGLAAANALGGIVAQTMFLALADISYRKGTVQREAVSRKSTAQLGLVVALLALVVMALGSPTATLGVHFTTPLLLAGYLSGVVMIRHIPAPKDDQKVDEASTTDAPTQVAQPAKADPGGAPLRRLWLGYAVLAAALAASGWALSSSVQPIAEAMNLPLTAAGGLLTALATSSPELLTAIAAARRGALRLAVGDIAGGNSFDVLFLAAADAAMLGGLYSAVGAQHVLLAGVALLFNAVLLIGFIRRGRGIGGRVAPESAIVLTGYIVVAAALVLR